MIIGYIISFWFFTSVTINSILLNHIRETFIIKYFYMNGLGGYYVILFGYLWFLDEKRIKHKFKIINTKHSLDYLIYRRENVDSYYRNTFINTGHNYFLESDEEISRLTRELKLLKLTL